MVTLLIDEMANSLRHKINQTNVHVKFIFRNNFAYVYIYFEDLLYDVFEDHPTYEVRIFLRQYIITIMYIIIIMYQKIIDTHSIYFLFIYTDYYIVEDRNSHITSAT